MHDVLQVHAPSLVNTIGHTAGALLFGVFVFLLLGDRTAVRQPGNKKAISAAALAFLWNFASLILVAAPNRFDAPWSAVSYSAVSLLPAVLFDLALSGRFRALVVAGYALSAAAIARVVRNDSALTLGRLGSASA